MNDIKLIEKLCCCRGASGFEDEVLAVAREYLDGIADFKEDAMRNLYIYPRYNKGGRASVLLDAHSDEVGFMVQAIKPDGTLRFIPLGYWNEQCLPSSKVEIYAKTRHITGVIAAPSPHLMTKEQRNTTLGYDSLVIDIGARSAEEAEAFGVEIGLPVVPVTPFEFNEKSGVMFGKAFDDRLGVAALLKCIKDLQNAPLAVDVIGLISSQEEVGTRGVQAAIRNIEAAAAICFEGCPADDVSAPSYMVQAALGGGVMLRHVDASVICSPRLVSLAREVAKEKSVKVQTAVRTGGGNNGAVIINGNGATPVIVAAIPVRYIHTFNGIALKEDFDSMVNLGAELVKALTPAKLAAL